MSPSQRSTIPLLLLGALAGCAPERAAAPPPQEADARGEAATEAGGRPPRFEEHPAWKVEGVGEPAAVDLSSHPRAREFRTALREGVARGPNYAGYLAVVSWGCGTMCQEFLIVDVHTGEVFDGMLAPLGVEHRLDSRLLVVNPPDRVAASGCSTVECAPRFFLWTGSQLRPLPPEVWTGSTAVPASAREFVAGVRTGEREDIAAHAAQVARPTWDRLEITAADGTRRVFTDDLEGGEPRWLHVFRGSVPPLEAYVVELVYAVEGRQLFLVDARNGEVLEVDEVPVPSPDGTYFVTASLDLVVGHLPNRVRVYRAGPGAPVLEWELEPREWGATGPVWLDERTVRLDRGVVDWAATPLEIRYSPIRLQRSQGGWTLVR